MSAVVQSGRIQAGVVLAFLLVALIGSSCSENGSSEAGSTSRATAVEGSTSSSAEAPPTTIPTEGTTAPPTSSTSPSASSTTESSLLSTSEKDLGNGRVRAGGFIKRAYEVGSERRIDIDYADFLSGDEAEAAAAAVGEEVNNDYFIRNQSSRLRTFRVTATSFELPQGDPTAPIMGDWAQFMGYLTEFPGTFWWLERQGDEVVLLEGQWVP